MNTIIHDRKLALDQAFQRNWKVSRHPQCMLSSLMVHRDGPLTDHEFADLVANLNGRVRHRYRVQADVPGLDVDEIVKRVQRLAKHRMWHRPLDVIKAAVKNNRSN
jgi:hypothetical protein